MIVVFLGAKLVMEGGFSVGMLIALIGFRTQFIERLSGFVNQFFNLLLVQVHLDRLADLYSEKEEASSGCQDFLVSEGKIELVDVSYKYHFDQPAIIKNLSLSIEAGKSTGIVAPSGYGKSTLIKLIGGLLTPTEGSVRYDNVEMNPFSMHSLRQHVATVMQDDVLFAGSIIENICFGSTEVNPDLVLDCAKRANIHDEILRLPMQYNTLVGDMGSALSGGQIQRILIARALYKQPKVLLLDEATSHLDAASDGYISESIDSLNVTRVIVAHNPASMKNCDAVFDLTSQSYVQVGECDTLQTDHIRNRSCTMQK